MTERTDAYAYFWVEGYTASPNEISARLDLTPTSMRRIGDVGRNGPPATSNSWRLLSPLARGDRLLQDYIEGLLSLLEPRASAVCELAAQYSVGINCVGYYYGSNPGLHLSSSLLARLAALRVAVDFDLYNYGEEDAA
jgi:hypothetical protein